MIVETSIEQAREDHWHSNGVVVFNTVSQLIIKTQQDTNVYQSYNQHQTLSSVAILMVFKLRLEGSHWRNRGILDLHGISVDLWLMNTQNVSLLGPVNVCLRVLYHWLCRFLIFATSLDRCKIATAIKRILKKEKNFELVHFELAKYHTTYMNSKNTEMPIWEIIRRIYSQNPKPSHLHTLYYH